VKVIHLLFLLFLTNNSYAQNLQNGLTGQWLTQDLDAYIMDFDSTNLVDCYAYDMPINMTFELGYLGSNEISLTPIFEKRAFGPLGTKGFAVVKTRNDSLTMFRQFKVINDTLFLVEQETGKTTKAISCRKGICNFEKMFFRNSKLFINLPVNKKNTTKTFEKSAKDIEIFGGPFKLMDIQILSNLRYFHYEGLPLDEVSIYTLLSEYRSLNEENPKIILWINDDTNMNLVADLLNLLLKYDVKTVYFGVKKSDILNEKFEPYLLPFSLKNIEVKAKLRFEDWLNGLE
jgi:hypothetical protein